MDEDRSPASARAPTPESAAPDSLSAIVPKRRLWPVFGFFFAVVALVGFFVFRLVTASDPLRILVAIDLDGYWWEGSEPAAKLCDALATHLAELGFSPVKGGDPKVMKILEGAKDPEAAARKLGAGFIIQAHLAPEVVEHPVKGGYFELRVDAPVKLTFLDNGTASEGRLRGYSGSTKKDQAMAVLADSMASQALDAVIGQLLDHPAVVEITSGSDVKLLERLQPARVFAKDRARRMKETAESYAKAAEEHETEGKTRLTFHSHAAANDILVGTGAGGIYVKTADVVPFFSLRRRDLARSEALETIALLPFAATPLPTGDPAATAPLWKGYHVFTYPSAERDGAHVALVEDLFGWAKTITLIDPAGTAKRVRVDPEHRFVDPKLSPGARFVAVYDRPRAGAPADLAVIETASGKEAFGFHTDNQSLGGFTWIDGARLAFFYQPETPAGEGQHLAVVDVGKQPFSIEHPYRTRPAQTLQTPSASRDGKQITWVEEGGEQGIAVIDTATWTRRLYPVPGGAAWPTFSPDGTHVVFETGGATSTSVDIGVLSLPSGAVKKVVEGKSEKRLPLFSADGQRVVFEVRYHDPVFPRARAVSRIASVAFEP
jgi:hypothetical protein